MSDGPDSLVLRFMRQVDAKLDRVIDDLGDIKVRVTNVEENLAALNRRVDRMDLRMERIERRLNLVETGA
jgi:archaellum component FlaC